VPDLDKHRELGVVTVRNDVLRATMVTLFRAFEARNFPRRSSKRAPVVVEYQGKILAWVGKRMLSHAIPDLEVVVLAKQLDGIVVAEDAGALRAADELGVPTRTTREVLAGLAARGSISDIAAVLSRIEATGYVPTRRASRSA
jgi:predicted DNA-binding protein (UPF0278 family)